LFDLNNIKFNKLYNALHVKFLLTITSKYFFVSELYLGTNLRLKHYLFLAKLADDGALHVSSVQHALGVLFQLDPTPFSILRMCVAEKQWRD